MQQTQKTKRMRPVTVRIAELKKDINEAVGKSELPPFMLEMVIGEYLTGISAVARKEYAKDLEEWEAEQKEGEEDGGH